MDRSPLDKEPARELYENNPIDEFALTGKTLPLVFSTLAFMGTGGEINVRLRKGMNDADGLIDFVITPYAAVRLGHALLDLVNRTGQFQSDAVIVDPDRGVMAHLKSPGRE